MAANTPPDKRALEDQARDWLVRLSSGRATSVDAQDFKRWCGQSPLHAQVMAETTRLWDATRPAAQALAQRMRADEPARRTAPAAWPRAGRRRFLGAALAAGATAFVLVRPPARLWPALSDMTADYRTGTGEQRQVVLADAVVVEMNTQTSLNLRRGADGEPVALELLDGEVQVRLPATRSTPLNVSASGGQLMAEAGSRFNVRATGAEVCVTCMAGAVTLRHGGRTLVAREAQQLNYGRHGAELARARDIAAVDAWRERVLVFNDMPLAEMVDEINRYRPGRLIVTNAELGRRRVQARLRLEQLARVETLIGASYGARVTMLPAGIVLLG
ncbi:FecR family protein [Variovorax boronicumulans]|uniref:FecR family protein n=1 Tax=Variovorax boronicumulans TaxID=436515 RepID=UPI00214CB6C9